VFSYLPLAIRLDYDSSLRANEPPNTISTLRQCERHTPPEPDIRQKARLRNFIEEIVGASTDGSNAYDHRIPAIPAATAKRNAQ
jgi:hypothetical protein